MTAGYFVNGVKLVGTGGEWCEACEKRPAVGRSISGCAVCARCAGWAAMVAEEMEKEKEESAGRRAARVPALRAAVARSQAHDDAQAAVSVIGPNTVQLRPENSRAEQKRKLRERNRDRVRFKCGHPRTAQNSYLRKDKPGRPPFRECKECAKARSKRPKNKSRACRVSDVGCRE